MLSGVGDFLRKSYAVCSSARKVSVFFSCSSNFEAKMNLELGNRLQAETYIIAHFCCISLALWLLGAACFKLANSVDSWKSNVKSAGSLLGLAGLCATWDYSNNWWPETCSHCSCNLGIGTMSSILVPAWKNAGRQLIVKTSRSDG